MTLPLGAEVASLGWVLASLLSQSCPPACSLGVLGFKVSRGVKASELCQAIALGVATESDNMSKWSDTYWVLPFVLSYLVPTPAQAYPCFTDEGSDAQRRRSLGKVTEAKGQWSD